MPFSILIHQVNYQIVVLQLFSVQPLQTLILFPLKLCLKLKCKKFDKR